MFSKLLKSDESVKEAYLSPKIEWSFTITLQCSEKIVDWKSSSHQLDFAKKNEKEFFFKLAEKEYPEKDLEFTFERANPELPLCTVGEECACLSFLIPSNEKPNFYDYKG